MTRKPLLARINWYKLLRIISSVQKQQKSSLNCKCRYKVLFTLFYLFINKQKHRSKNVPTKKQKCNKSNKSTNKKTLALICSTFCLML